MPATARVRAHESGRTQHRTTSPAVLAAIRQRQKPVWAAGDYAVIGNAQQIVAERLCEAAEVRAGEHVLDVAAGTGNGALAAARRYAHVIATDFVPEHLSEARRRVTGERLAADFRVADAEDLPFIDGMFDVVLSCFGSMFTPNQEKAARELSRVCRSGGRIALANWTADGFMGQVHALIDKYVPRPAGVLSPMLWGREDRLRDLFGARVSMILVTPRTLSMCYRSAENWLAVFQTFYGPLNRALDSLDPDSRGALQGELLDTARACNRGPADRLTVPSGYVEAVVYKR